MRVVDNPRVVANCRILAQECKPGTCWYPMEASKNYRNRFLRGELVIRDRVGGQTIAAILVKHCGWERVEGYVLKPGLEPPIFDSETFRKISEQCMRKVEAIRRINMRIKEQAKKQAKRKPVEI